MGQGKKKYIESPEKLLEMFKHYKDSVKSNPILIHDFLGGRELYEVRKEKERPLTMDGFEIFCLENYSDVHHYFDNDRGAYEEFRTVCTRIKKAIRADQINGGMTGIYNPSITQRLNNLVERTENTNIEKKLPDWMKEGDEG